MQNKAAVARKFYSDADTARFGVKELDDTHVELLPLDRSGVFEGDNRTYDINIARSSQFYEVQTTRAYHATAAISSRES